MPSRPTKAKAFEALDSIASILKRHEKDLDRLISELGKTTEKLGGTEEMSETIRKVEERLSAMETEIPRLIKHNIDSYFSNLKRHAMEDYTIMEGSLEMAEERLSNLLEKVRRLQRERVDLVREIRELKEEVEKEGDKLEREVSMFKEQVTALKEVLSTIRARKKIS